MPRYIVRPALSSTGLATARRLDREHRARQTLEVLAHRGRDPEEKELVRWLGSAPTVQVLGGPSVRATGTRVVDMPPEEAERLERELPNVTIFQDGPVDLIRPVTASATLSSLTSADLWHLDRIGLISARTSGFGLTGQGVQVAVLDTGIEGGHPELEDRVVHAITLDTNAWEVRPLEPSTDTDGHGTHVSGLLCGKGVGVAPAATVINVVTIPGGQGNLSDFVLAMEWIARQPAIKLVNISAGFRGYHPEMRGVVQDLLDVGVVCIAAVGNEGRLRTRSPGNYIEVFSVGASDKNDKVASFSGGGLRQSEDDGVLYTMPDGVAPGDGVYSCVMGGGYEAWSGTSMATPIVSGIAALLLERNPTISATDLIEELLANCQDLGLDRERQGTGRIRIGW